VTELDIFLKIIFGVFFLSIVGINNLLVALPHHNPVKYPNQRLFIVQIRDYVYYVPFVENEETIFLKNIIPSRKYQKKYLEGVKHES